MRQDVLIVGAGPVGLTMAIELARYGVPVRIVEKAAQRTDKSKALVIWSRTLEMMERSGCSATLIAAGYQVDSINLSANKAPIGRISFESLDTAYRYALMIAQSETERVLEERLQTLGVTVERSTELTGFMPSLSAVPCSLRRADGSEESVEASWLIGCDGAHSTIRHGLGMEFHGATSPIRWILADLHLEGAPPRPEVQIAWHADGVLAIFPITENRFRVVADAGLQTPDDGPDATPTIEQVQAILDKRYPGTVRATNPVWLASFTINERKVKEYRAGRVFLAGDAAHVHSPAGGQGMNTGMQDACNLAWKLAMTIHGTGGADLLASYSPERSHVAEQVLKATGRATEMATITSETIQWFRNHAASLLLGLAPVRTRAANLLSEISVGYAESPLNESAAHADPAPGERAPIRPEEQPFGAGKTPLFALCASVEGMPSGLLQRHTAVLEQSVRAPYDPAGLWLVRPDGYVALSAKADDWQRVETYLQRIAADDTAGA